MGAGAICDMGCVCVWAYLVLGVVDGEGTGQVCGAWWRHLSKDIGKRELSATNGALCVAVLRLDNGESDSELELGVPVVRPAGEAAL